MGGLPHLPGVPQVRPNRFDEISPRSRKISQSSWRDLFYLAQLSIMSAKSHRDLREITNVAEFLARSLLSRRKLFHIGVTSFVSQKYLSSRRDLVSISPEIAFISCQSQRHYKSRRVLGEISFISPRPQRHYQSCRVIGDISAKSRLSRRDLRGITNLAEFLTRSRRDLVYLAAISDTRSRKR